MQYDEDDDDTLFPAVLAKTQLLVRCAVGPFFLVRLSPVVSLQVDTKARSKIRDVETAMT